MLVVGSLCLLLAGSALIYANNWRRLKGENQIDINDDPASIDFELEHKIRSNATYDMVDIGLKDSDSDISIKSNDLPGTVNSKGVSSIGKIFKKSSKPQGLSWKEIRDAGSPEPAKGETSISSLSPSLTPQRNISSMRMKLQSLVSLSSNDTDDLSSVEEGLGSNDDTPIEERRAPENVRANVEHMVETDCMDSPSIFSGLEMSSTGARDQSFERNIGKLKSILGTIKSLGSYEESLMSSSSAGTSDGDFKNKAFARMGISKDHANDRQNVFRCYQGNHPSNREMKTSHAKITFENELLSACCNSDSFNFKRIFTDPKNVVYECRVPSGPVGIVVDATQVGLRVQKISDMSPIGKKISVGDM